jgi:hypothetical protein
MPTGAIVDGGFLEALVRMEHATLRKLSFALPNGIVSLDSLRQEK